MGKVCLKTTLVRKDFKQTLKIIIKIPLDINEELNVENLEELEEKIENLKIRIKRLAFKNRLKNLIGKFEIEETSEEDIFKREKILN
ncbi:MAG: hypothetical protein DSY60_00280 [Persephonella sp.]|nr:MAG: hypothetical protein DSY60_00280 [Persephonella sp.]